MSLCEFYRNKTNEPINVLQNCKSPGFKCYGKSKGNFISFCKQSLKSYL